MRARNIIHLTQREYDGLYERNPSTFYVIESQTFIGDYADVSVTTTGYSEIGFRNWNGSHIVGVFEIEWKLDGTDIWNKTSVMTPSFVLPFPGKCKIRFVDKQYKCIFGNGITSHAAAFTEIEFGEDYKVEDWSNMFANCVSLTSVPSLGNSWNTTQATNMFEEATPSMDVWDINKVYNIGDIITYDGVICVAIETSFGINPTEDKDSWLLISNIETEPEREEIPLKVRENIAGISNCDIPE